jgi:hypothetical protein
VKLGIIGAGAIEKPISVHKSDAERLIAASKLRRQLNELSGPKISGAKALLRFSCVLAPDRVIEHRFALT